MREELIGFALFAAFVVIGVMFVRHANSRDRYESTLYDMPIWWLKKHGFSRRRA